MFEATIAGSLPKPSWLAEPDKLWPAWRLAGPELAAAKRDATLLVIKEQEDAGIDIVTDGEQSRQHFVHSFLEYVEGIDFTRRVEMGIRKDRYKAMVPTVVGPLGLKGRVHATEARLARTHTKRRLKFTLPGPMTIVDTIANDYYRDPAVHRAIEGLPCVTAVHICYGYGIAANLEWQASLGGEWRQYEAIFPALAASHIQQVSIECRNSRVPISLLGLLDGKDVLLGVIDVASDQIETPEEVVATIEQAMRYVPAERIFPCTNCGMAPMHRETALAKLAALGRGAVL